MITCSFMEMTDGCTDDPNKPEMFDLLCAGSCQYQGPCKGDPALAVLFSDDDEDENADDDDEPMTCSMFAMLDGMGGLPDMGAVGTQLYSIAREICAPARRARKMTNAAPVDEDNGSPPGSSRRPRAGSVDARRRWPVPRGPLVRGVPLIDAIAIGPDSVLVWFRASRG